MCVCVCGGGGGGGGGGLPGQGPHLPCMVVTGGDHHLLAWVHCHCTGEGRGLYSPAGVGSTGSPAGCVVVCSEGVCGLQSPRAGEVGAGRPRGVEVRVGWLCWEHHCTRLQGRAPAQSVCRHSASEHTLHVMAAIGAEGSGYTAAGRQGGREGMWTMSVQCSVGLTLVQPILSLAHCCLTQ